VRNSGAVAVVEGVGDHGCEYMTGGRVVILGETGRNFAAGMSGGVAYIFDPKDEFPSKCNMGMVALQRVESEAERRQLFEFITQHFESTASPIAKQILNNWAVTVPQFVKVMPHDYQRVLEANALLELAKNLKTVEGEGNKLAI
jgi:glutamate synthase domain-containing protein 3